MREYGGFKEIDDKMDMKCIEEKKVSIRIIIEEVLEKLYETDARLVRIIGGLEGQNDPEPKMTEDVCCMKDEIMMISEVANRLLRKTRMIEESLL